MDSPAIFENNLLRLSDCRYGPTLYIKADQYIGRSLEHYGEYSHREAVVFAQIVRPGQVVLDVGANVGVFTQALAHAVTSAGAVLSFEPQRFVHQVLCANVALGGLTWVRTFHAAVGREAGSILVPVVGYAVAGNYGGLALGGFSKGEPVPVLTIDSLKLRACHFAKIDVEGMELDVVAGADETIARCRPVLYMENNRREKSSALIGHLFDRNYRLYWHFAPMFNPDNHNGATDDIFGRIISTNMLCMPKEDRRQIRKGFTEITDIDDWPDYGPPKAEAAEPDGGGASGDAGPDAAEPQSGA
jgi:FkbM family methyltransferase